MPNNSEKKLTETEQLELNTKIQKAKEQAEEIKKFLIIRNKMMVDFGLKAMYSMLISLACLAVSIVGSIKGWVWLDIVGHILWVLFFLGHFFMLNLKDRAQGEFDGAWAMLVILGHVVDDEPKGGKRKRKVKKRSMFARPKEFFERMNKSKEAYGGA